MNHFLLFAASLSAFQADPSFRSDTRVVNVNAIVRAVGADGQSQQPLTGLSAEQFRLKIDGKERQIRYFHAGESTRRPLALMVYFNLAPEGALRQLSQSATQASFAAALKRLSPQDEVSVYAAKDWFVGQPRQVSPLGTDREASASALYQSVHASQKLSAAERKAEGQSRDRSMSAAIEAASDLAISRPDLQVALVYISDGMNTLDTMLTKERNPLLDRLLEQNISFSAINLDMKGSYAAAAATLNPLGKLMGFSVSGFGDGFAKNTGGLSLDIPEPETLGAALEEIVNAYAASYSLGYQCQGEEYLDGKWHKIEVSVRGLDQTKPIGSVHVSARKRFRF